MKRKGKVRAIGITECFGADTGHAMLPLALSDDTFDVIMAGFNLLNPGARKRVLRSAADRNVGVFGMFAVRRALRDMEALTNYLHQQIADHNLTPAASDLTEVLHQSLSSGECESLSELAYRYCLHEPHLHCVLTGTGSPEHLRRNLTHIEKGPLSEETRRNIESITGDWDHLSGQ